MPDAMSRRTFLKACTAFSATSLFCGSIDCWIQKTASATGGIDLAAVQGSDFFQNTIQAVELLGGMGTFVPAQSRVGLLVDGLSDTPGSYVHPDIVLAVIRMCREAGTREIGVFTRLGRGYWQPGGGIDKYRDENRGIASIGGDYTEVAIPYGRSLKRAEVAKSLLDRDVFINMPIAKNHTRLGFSGTITNMMGLTSFTTSMFFHHGSGKLGWYDDIEFLAQCIADVNLVRKPTLCIVDAGEVLATNGPRGPGTIVRPHKILAGVDRVALDVYGANLLGRQGDENRTTRLAHEHGLGELDLSRLRIAEVTI